MTAKKIQPTNPSAAPSEANKGDDKNSTRKSTPAFACPWLGAAPVL